MTAAGPLSRVIVPVDEEVRVGRRAGSLVLVTALVVAACSGGEPDEAVPTTTASPEATTPAEVPSSTPGPTTPPTEPPPDRAALEEVSVGWRSVGSGFSGPLQVLTDPRDGRTLVVEQVGRIRTLDGTTVLDLTDRVTTAGNEQGLLGVAFHPGGDRLFVHYSGADGRTVLSEFPAGGELSAGAETVLLTEPQPASNHNGGALLFTPDGALVLALGDGGAAGDRFGNGQDTDTRLGGLLRLDVSTPGQAQPHPDNPFLDGGAPALWAYGLRNPWRVDVDPDHWYVADVGQDAVEEVSVVPRGQMAGANFGWPILEGSQCYRSSDCDASGTVAPTVELRHADGACSIIGGVVVPDGHPTGLGGAYLFSDLCDTRLRALRAGGASNVVVDGGQLPGSPLGFGRGADGQIWVGTADGEVLELRPA